MCRPQRPGGGAESPCQCGIECREEYNKVLQVNIEVCGCLLSLE